MDENDSIANLIVLIFVFHLIIQDIPSLIKIVIFSLERLQNRYFFVTHAKSDMMAGSWQELLGEDVFHALATIYTKYFYLIMLLNACSCLIRLSI